TMKNLDDWTALHWAIYSTIEKVKILLDAAGENTWNLLTMQCSRGNTALHYLAKCKLLETYKKIETIQFLLDIAGDKAQEFIHIPNNKGKTAFDLAKTPEIKKVMQQYLNK